MCRTKHSTDLDHLPPGQGAPLPLTGCNLIRQVTSTLARIINRKKHANFTKTAKEGIRSSKHEFDNILKEENGSTTLWGSKGGNKKWWLNRDNKKGRLNQRAYLFVKPDSVKSHDFISLGWDAKCEVDSNIIAQIIFFATYFLFLSCFFLYHHLHHILWCVITRKSYSVTVHTHPPPPPTHPPSPPPPPSPPLVCFTLPC